MPRRGHSSRNWLASRGSIGRCRGRSGPQGCRRRGAIRPAGMRVTRGNRAHGQRPSRSGPRAAPEQIRPMGSDGADPAQEKRRSRSGPPGDPNQIVAISNYLATSCNHRCHADRSAILIAMPADRTDGGRQALARHPLRVSSMASREYKQQARRAVSTTSGRQDERQAPGQYARRAAGNLSTKHSDTGTVYRHSGTGRPCHRKRPVTTCVRPGGPASWAKCAVAWRGEPHHA